MLPSARSSLISPLADVDMKIIIYHVEGKDHIDRKDHDVGKYRIEGNDYPFTAEGKGTIPTRLVNPVTVGLTIGDVEGSTAMKADVDR